MIDSTSHPNLSIALDIADKLIKLAAVLIGGAWTWWNYRKSRTYEQKLDLQISGTVFLHKGTLYGDVSAIAGNIGASNHSVQQAGTYCELSVVRDDLTESPVRLFDAFRSQDKIEPGESIDETHYWRIDQPIDKLLWVKLSLAVVSNGVEWRTSCLIRIPKEAA